MRARPVAGELAATVPRTTFAKLFRRGTLAKSPPAWPRLQLPLITILTALLAGRLFRLTARYAVNIFFWDQWGFNDATVFQEHSWWQAFRWQYGPHRLGLGAVIEKLIDPWTRWNSRWESFFICAVVLASTAAALALKRLLFGSFNYADVIIPLAFLSPVSYEAIFGTPNLAHGSLPLLLAVCYGLAWTVRRQGWRYFLILIVNFLMIYTGFGIFMGFVTPLALLADWRLHARNRGPFLARYTAAAVLLSLLSLASFFWDYKLILPACPVLPIRGLAEYFDFIAAMFANFLGFAAPNREAILAGGSVVCLMAVSLGNGIGAIIRRPGRDGLQKTVAVSLMAYCLLFCVNAAFGRICFGVAAGFASRYMMYLMAGLLGLYFFVLAQPRVALRRGGMLLLLTIGLFASAGVHRQDRHYMRRMALLKRTWKSCYLRTADVAQCDSITGRALNSSMPVSIYPHPEVLRQKLEFVRTHRLNLYADTK